MKRQPVLIAAGAWAACAVAWAACAWIVSTLDASTARAQGPDAALAAETVAEIRAFADALEACTPASVALTDPFAGAAMTEYTVTGAQADGTCAMTQTLPGGQAMECAFSEGGRAALAADLRWVVADSPLELPIDETMPDWTTECVFVLPDGQRLTIEEVMEAERQAAPGDLRIGNMPAQ